MLRCPGRVPDGERFNSGGAGANPVTVNWVPFCDRSCGQEQSSGVDHRIGRSSSGDHGAIPLRRSPAPDIGVTGRGDDQPQPEAVPWTRDRHDLLQLRRT